jgi:hypothetical protein
MLSYYIYSHTYEVEYGFCVMIIVGTNSTGVPAPIAKKLT